MNKSIALARNEFTNIFGETPKFYGSAPGRIEVLGNHTDYNNGFVIAAAIDRSITAVGRPIPGDTAKIYSLTFNAGASFSINEPTFSPKEHWLNYVMGVIWQLQKRGYRPGAFEALVAGDVPLGAGLSSSAAMEMATGHFIKAMLGFDMSPMDMALNCQAAENDFVGMQCGIMDQWTSSMGREGRLLLLDCRKLEIFDYAPLPERLKLVVADTNSPHSLSASEYNKRRASCFRAASICAEKITGKKITHLRDVTLEELESCRNAMSDEDFRRARHIVTDNARALAGTEALENGDVVRLGSLMTESHESSRHDFENSGPELDAMVGAAAGLPGCYGSRLMGGGFGGAVLNLVDADAVDEFAAALKERYRAATTMEGSMYTFKPSNGAEGGKF